MCKYCKDATCEKCQQKLKSIRTNLAKKNCPKPMKHKTLCNRLKKTFKKFFKLVRF